MNFIYHHRTLGDGAEGIHIREIVKALRHLGHRVKLVSLIGEEQLINPQKRVAESRWSWIKNFMPGFVFELIEIAYNITGYRMILKAARGFEADIIYDRYISYNYSAILAGKKLGIPVILEVNSPYATQRRVWEKIYFPRLIQYFETKITNGADRVIVVSTALKNHLEEHGTQPDKIVVMPNGTDPNVFNPGKYNGKFRERYHIRADDTVLGFVGVLRKWHNIEMLLEAFQELQPAEHNLKLIFVGDGPVQGELEEKARSMGIEKQVIFTGRVPHQEVPEHIAMFDVAISPHVTYYSSPMKILEYMAMGKCTVAPDMTNIRDIIKPGETGILFKPKNKSDLRDKLLEVIRRAEWRKTIGETAAREVHTKRTWEKNAREVVRLGEQLLRERAGK